METIIKRLLVKQEMSVNKFAKTIDANRSWIYNVVNGQARASVPLRGKMAKAMGFPVEMLFCESGMARQVEKEEQ